MSEMKKLLDIRVEAAKRGDMLWRNNVGATPSKEVCTCSFCGRKTTIRRTPVRYGLANDSAKLNEFIKSADLIGITRKVITPQDVGQIVGQFTSIEVKPDGWKYTGAGREKAQRNWLDLVNNMSGLAVFR